MRRSTDHTLEWNIAVLSTEMKNIVSDISEIKELFKSAQNKYVTLDQFLPVRNGFYGFVGLIVTIVIGAIIRSALIK